VNYYAVWIQKTEDYISENGHQTSVAQFHITTNVCVFLIGQWMCSVKKKESLSSIEKYKLNT